MCEKPSDLAMACYCRALRQCDLGNRLWEQRHAVDNRTVAVNQGAGKQSPRPATVDGGRFAGLRPCRMELATRCSLPPVG
ncbi:hypothetical protein C3469_23595 [Mycobacterium kansasii]|nr:hypothetical protein C3B43_21750 [Mycobacterium kansasii]POX97911.1 hypothetical protein C3479_24215 [Mycobacterium kansasii]POY05023.1 hypothetical protein C3477_15060 [Mycobacterium kansasii]POY15833.1 hypothetical protein C3476_23985 [Mycobacterium kansasii]POY22569.1 hypothetical protein C3469_23595 [Mycobacterium kansasii]